MAWIGVDLDGTLAEYHGDASIIGRPVEPMLARVKGWLATGREVRIFTARANDKAQLPKIQEWLRSVGLPQLAITATKDYQMIELWDDRAVEVMRNKGIPVSWTHQ